MQRIIAAYTMSPGQADWDPAKEEAYYEGIFAIPGVDGLEIPFDRALHPHDEGWLLKRLPAGSRHVVTCLPGTMGRLAQAPGFGLASEDAEARQAAVEFARAARSAVLRLNDAAGAASVTAVALHSAPALAAPGVRSSAAALAASLGELATLDWQGAALVIEHCDAFDPAFPPQKGFLGLDQELAALADLPGAGICINWGRSVIETRQPGTAAAHAAAAQAAGRLAGLMFSGCSGEAGQPYGAWQDNHMPHAPGPGLAFGAPGSLLTAARVAETLAAGRPGYVGVKLGARPATMGVAHRLGALRELFGVVAEAVG